VTLRWDKKYCVNCFARLICVSSFLEFVSVFDYITRRVRHR